MQQNGEKRDKKKEKKKTSHIIKFIDFFLYLYAFIQMGSETFVKSRSKSCGKKIPHISIHRKCSEHAKNFIRN